LIREIKKSSNEFIKENMFSKFRFNWQEGFGAFSYSHSQLHNVIAYIMNQKEHHRKKTFKEEYTGLLKRFNVAYDEQYLFECLPDRQGLNSAMLLASDKFCGVFYIRCIPLG